jgi:RimJ/RimL family protein N-acetyltransferase
MPSFPDLQVPLTDGKVSLRPNAERDIPEILIAHQDDPELHDRLGESRPPSGAQLGQAAERAEAERLAGRKVALTITEPGSDVCRGQVTVDKVDWATACAEMRVWVAPQFRGRGFARRAVALVAAWLFEASALKRLELPGVTLTAEP